MRAKQRPVSQQAGLFIDPGVTAAFRIHLHGFCRFPERFNQMGLHAGFVLRRQPAQPAHQFPAAGRREPRCQDRLRGPVMPAAGQEILGLCQ